VPPVQEGEAEPGGDDQVRAVRPDGLLRPLRQE